MSTKLLSIHYKIVDCADGIPTVLDEGDTFAEIDCTESTEVSNQLEKVRYEIGGETGLKVVFVSISTICEFTDVSIAEVVTDQVITTFDGSYTVANRGVQFL